MNKKIPAYFLFLSLSLIPHLAASYNYNQESSRVEFTVKHLGLTTLHGHFEIFSGSFRYDPAKVEDSEVVIAIKTASVESGNSFSNSHLKSEGFFWAERHPEIKFQSKEFTIVDETHFDIYGDLTIRGNTRPVIFKTKLLTKKQSVTGKDRIWFQSETFIKRKDFKLGTGNWLDPIVSLADETLKISLNVEGIPTA